MSLDRRHTEPERLRELRLAKERRSALGLVRERIERSLELLAVDAVDDTVDLLCDALQLLEVETS
jgi:hypothetical protein